MPKDRHLKNLPTVGYFCECGQSHKTDFSFGVNIPSQLHEINADNSCNCALHA